MERRIAVAASGPKQWAASGEATTAPWLFGVLRQTAGLTAQLSAGGVAEERRANYSTRGAALPLTKSAGDCFGRFAETLSPYVIGGIPHMAAQAVATNSKRGMCG